MATLNRIFIRKIIITISLLLFSLYLFPQETDSISQVSSNDTLTNKAVLFQPPAVITPQKDVDFRVPDEAKIEKYQNDRRFEYTTSYSIFDKVREFKYSLSKWLKSLFENSSLAEGALLNGNKIFYILAGIFLIVLLVLFILKLKGIKIRKLIGKEKLDTPEIEFYTENVHEMNFNSLLENALKNKDYRLAVRFLYLRNLKSLSDNSIIKWNINKTNYSYQFEITDNTLRSKFLENTFIFDYVWYGEFSLTEEQYMAISAKMEDFNKMIISNEK